MMANDFQLSCEVCGRRRPDQELAVHSRKGTIRGTEFARNVTHCHDDSGCAEDVRLIAEAFIVKFEVTQ